VLFESPILVTGGLGFIGGHLVDGLVASGATNIRVFDNSYRAVTPADNWPGNLVTRIHGDIRDSAALQHATRGCKVVFHLAAQSNVMGAVSDPEYSCTTNVGGTLNVLNAASTEGVRRVVFTSSREVYGDVEHIPVSESTPLHPKNLYGASKAAGEMYCRALASKELEIVILRLANVYGPRDRDRVIPIFVSNALEGKPLTLHGGDQILDFVWIQTVIDALLEAGYGASLPHPLNVGSGVGTTVQALAHRVIESTLSGSKCVYVPKRCLEVTKFVADMSLAKKNLRLADVEDPLEYLGQLTESSQTQAASIES
jgi:UDP-glucose 4-epimerase